MSSSSIGPAARERIGNVTLVVSLGAAIGAALEAFAGHFAHAAYGQGLAVYLLVLGLWWCSSSWALSSTIRR